MLSQSSAAQGAGAVAPPPAIVERGVVVAGVRIATAMSDAPRALLARAPLVVLPAAGFAWGDYRAILERFAPERRVFALDWPGFGASEKPTPAEFEYSAEHFAELLGGWLDTLGIARAVLLGNAVGAAAAIRYAAAHPQRAAGVALVAPEGFTAGGPLLFLAMHLLGTPAALRRLDSAVTSLALGPDTVTTRGILDAHRARRHGPDYAATIQAAATLWRRAMQPSASLAEVAAQVTAPAIVLRGALDPICTAADARRTVEAIGGRGALEVVLPEAGHLPFLQQSERFYQAIAGLLATAELRAQEGA
jgi:pimeloyl-ACP methyl ester carboxylesterase